MRQHVQHIPPYGKIEEQTMEIFELVTV